MKRDNPSGGATRWLRIGAMVAAIALLVWLLHGVGWDRVGGALRQVGGLGAAALFGLGLVESLVDVAALGASLRPALTPLQAFSYNSLGSLVNQLVPWDGGELVKIALFRRHTSPTEAISGIVIWNYVFKATRPAVGLVAAVVGVAVGTSVADPLARAILIGTALAFAPFFALRLLLRSGAAARLVGLARLLRLRSLVSERLRERAMELDRSLKNFRAERPGAFGRIVAGQLAARGISWVTLHVAALGIGLHYSFAMSSLVYAGLGVSSYLAALLPARIGVTEGAAFVLFEAVGLPGSDGLLLALVLRLKDLAVNGVGALAAGCWGGTAGALGGNSKA